MLARFVGGWGVLGGLRVSPGVGGWRSSLTRQTSRPTRRSSPGPSVQIPPGVGIDAGGRTLALCSARTLNLDGSRARPPRTQTQPCSTWFAPLEPPLCPEIRDGDGPRPRTGSSPSPSRPPRGRCPSSPAEARAIRRRAATSAGRSRASRSGSCPRCRPRTSSRGASRGALAVVELSRLPSRPSTVTPACRAPPRRHPAVAPALLEAARRGRSQKPARCTLLHEYAILDAIGEAVANACCTDPGDRARPGAVHLEPTALPGGHAGRSGCTPILLDGYPFRRVIASAALESFLTATAAGSGERRVRGAGPGSRPACERRRGGRASGPAPSTACSTPGPQRLVLSDGTGPRVAEVSGQPGARPAAPRHLRRLPAAHGYHLHRQGPRPGVAPTPAAWPGSTWSRWTRSTRAHRLGVTTRQGTLRRASP